MPFSSLCIYNVYHFRILALQYHNVAVPINIQLDINIDGTLSCTLFGTFLRHGFDTVFATVYLPFFVTSAVFCQALDITNNTAINSLDYDNNCRKLPLLLVGVCPSIWA